MDWSGGVKQGDQPIMKKETVDSVERILESIVAAGLPILSLILGLGFVISEIWCGCG